MTGATAPAEREPPVGRFALLRRWARRIKQDTYALALACRDPRVPWYAKVVAVCVVAYAFSPIDLILDFIPVLGYLDDVIVVPLGIILALKLIPAPVMADCRAQAAHHWPSSKPKSLAGAAAVVTTWLVLAALAIAWASRILSPAG